MLFAWGFIYLFLDYQLKSSINRQFQTITDSVQRLFEIDLEHNKKGLHIELDNMLTNPNISKAVEEEDYETLNSLTLPFYAKLKDTYPALNILTFRSPKGITLFRAHKPEFFGDTLNEKRALITDTNTLHRSFSGFEVGKLEMTYRITKPIFYKEVYVGNVELGISPESFLKDLHAIFKADIGIAIDKSLLDIMLEKEAVSMNEQYLLISKNKNLIKNREDKKISFTK